MKTFRPGEIARAQDINSNFNEVHTLAQAALPASRIRVGKITASNIPRHSFQNFTVTMSPPMPNSDYTVIITLGGSGAGSPELMTAAVKTGDRTPTTFTGRIRNNANSTQSCEITYLAIAN